MKFTNLSFLLEISVILIDSLITVFVKCIKNMPFLCNVCSRDIVAFTLYQNHFNLLFVIYVVQSVIEFRGSLANQMEEHCFGIQLSQKAKGCTVKSQLYTSSFKTLAARRWYWVLVMTVNSSKQMESLKTNTRSGLLKVKERSVGIVLGRLELARQPGRSA